MSTLYNPSELTAADIVERFGPMPISRVVSRPAPGSATVDDVVRLNDHEDRLCELVDGVLVEKTMGALESFLAGKIITLLNNYLTTHKMGIALSPDGMIRLFPDQVRIPDASYISSERLANSGWPNEAALRAVPDLAVEVLSPGNTQLEMRRKLEDYFAAGVRLVWYVDPRKKSVEVHESLERSRTVAAPDALDGGDVLPGLTIDLDDLFTLPTPPSP